MRTTVRNKIKQVIVIQTTIGRRCWVENILKSLEGYNKYPIFVFQTDKSPVYKYLRDYLDCDEIALLHDSMEITDTQLFDILFEDYAGKSVAFFGSANAESLYVPFAIEMGKFKLDLLKKMDIPRVHNKKEDMDYEPIFGNDYFALDQDTVTLFGDNSFDGQEVEKCGRLNRIIKTPYFIKYQGHWEKCMCPETELM